MIKGRSLNYNIIYALLAFIGVIITIMAATNPDEKDIHLIENKAASYNSGWQYKNNRVDTYDECNLPLELDRNAYRDMTVRKLLGSEAADGTYIMYRSKHAENHVYVGEEEIYVFGDKQLSLFPLPGSAWILIPLHDSYQGQYLTINLHRIESKYGGLMGDVVIGDRADMLELLLTENLFGFISCFVIAFVSLLLLFIGCIQLRMVGNHSLFYLSIFTLILALWSMNETHLSQLFIGNMEFVSILTYESIAFLPMPMISFFRSSKHEQVREACIRVAPVPIINFVLINGLHFFGICDLSETLILTHISIFVISIVIAVGHIRSGFFAKSSDSGIPELTSIGFIIFIVSAFIDIGHYYASSFVDASRYSRIGLLIFVLMLAVDSMFNSLSEELDIRKAELYKSLAFTDSLTGLGNRQAYEQEIENIDEKEELLDHLAVGILDLNNLKTTNDSKGHAEGDRYIITCSGFFQQYFGKIAKIFRIGGDEFAIVFTGHESDVFFETEANMFDDIMKEGNLEMNFSYGSAVFNHITDRNASDTIRRAEAKMYESKRKYKHTVSN